MTKRVPYLLGILGIAILVAVTIVFSQRVQDLQKSTVSQPKAAREVSFALEPATATIPPGGNQTVAIVAVVNEAPISSFNVRLSLPAGTLTPSNLTLNPTLASSGLWTFPIQIISGPINNAYTVNLSAVSTDIAGAPAGRYTLATFDLVAGTPLNSVSVPVNFDTSITQAVPKDDTVALPILSLTNGNYLVSGTITPTPIHTPIPTPTTPPQLTTSSSFLHLSTIPLPIKPLDRLSPAINSSQAGITVPKSNIVFKTLLRISFSVKPRSQPRSILITRRFTQKT